jgi:hypothetical protein
VRDGRFNVAAAAAPDAVRIPYTTRQHTTKSKIRAAIFFMGKVFKHPRMLRAGSREQICELCHRVSKSLYLVDLFMACEECWTISRLDNSPAVPVEAPHKHATGSTI